ncbi:MAG: type II secretion system F family protein [bacterium]|nr:type II secretion system F family protein [bacterium]MDT8395517.1 type II secretion system F family protein [bacterium]
MGITVVTGLLVAMFTTGIMVLVTEYLSGDTEPVKNMETKDRRTSAITISAMSSMAFLITIFTSFSPRVAILSTLAILFCWALLISHTHRKVVIRRAAIRRDLPMLLDYLVLQVESGHSLLSALRSAPSLFKPSAPLCQSLTELDRHLKVGETFQGALEKTIQFMNSPEAEVPFQAISGALRHGTPMGAMLREQSVRMREHMILEGEQFANTASIKILIPLLFFIFPAAFLVIFSPVIVSLAGRIP